MRPIACSAVAFVRTPGVFVTTTARSRAGLEIDVVEAHCVVRDDSELRACAIEKCRVDGDRRSDDDTVRAVRRVDDFERRTELLLDLGGHPRRFVHAGPCQRTRGLCEDE